VCLFGRRPRGRAYYTYIHLDICMYTHLSKTKYFEGDCFYLLTFLLACLLRDADACVCLDDDSVDSHTIHISIWIYVYTHTCLITKYFERDCYYLLTILLACLLRDADACVCLDDDSVDNPRQSGCRRQRRHGEYIYIYICTCTYIYMHVYLYIHLSFLFIYKNE